MECLESRNPSKRVFKNAYKGVFFESDSRSSEQKDAHFILQDSSWLIEGGLMLFQPRRLNIKLKTWSLIIPRIGCKFRVQIKLMLDSVAKRVVEVAGASVQAPNGLRIWLVIVPFVELSQFLFYDNMDLHMLGVIPKPNSDESGYLMNDVQKKLVWRLIYLLVNLNFI
ncbi:hypothetical protein GOBAR_DD08086 [Gossypium barbadense]|nr:hypothetical protein GOBAR_DD08086 [Gossypium barbadense]